MAIGRPKTPSDKKWPDVVGDVRVNLQKMYNRIDSSAGPNACWDWHGPKHRQGMGMVGGERIATGKKLMMTVTRLLLKVKLGYDPGPTVDAMHTCGNMKCHNPAHIVPGNASQILNLRVQRSGRWPGKPVGYVHDTPRNQRYRYQIKNICALARDEITHQEFAQLENIPEARAYRIKHFIDNDKAYRWAKNYQGPENE